MSFRLSPAVRRWPILFGLVSALVTAPLIAGTIAAPSAAAEPGGDRPSPGELDKRIVAAARQLEVVVEDYNESRDDLRTTEAQAAALGRRLAPMTVDLERRQAEFSELMGRTYQRTRSGPTVALFGSEDPHQFVDRLLVLNQLAVGEQRAAADLERTRTDIATTRAALAALAARQRRQQLQLNARKATIVSEIETLKQMRMAAYGYGSRFAEAADLSAPPYVAGRAGSVVAFAFGQLGKPYSWGAAGPRSYDCSGLTLAAWNTAGVNLPHNAARQYRTMAHVSRSQLKPGDLVFFYGGISHVGVYIGNGMMIHAPEYGENVRVAPIDQQPIHGFGRPG